MQLNRCPICHSRISLEAVVQDEAGRELLGLLAAMDNELAQALVGYLGLFRSASRDLQNDKALHLAKEALKLGCDKALPIAMRKTVESLRSKVSKPLSDHKYLKAVLVDVEATIHTPTQSLQAVGWVGRSETHTHTGTSAVNKDGFRDAQPILPARNLSKTAQALQSLEDFGNE